jgi:anti-sigma regulatory factor (Ser/Thr protein kinase)
MYTKCLLREWNLAALTDEVELLVSELVTNAIAATEGLRALIRPPVRLRLLSDRQRVVIEVWDASVKPPVPTDANLTASHGRGLLLVDMVSERWAWMLTPQRGGKVVWCEMRVPA